MSLNLWLFHVPRLDNPALPMVPFSLLSSVSPLVLSLSVFFFFQHAEGSTPGSFHRVESLDAPQQGGRQHPSQAGGAGRGRRRGQHLRLIIVSHRWLARRVAASSKAIASPSCRCFFLRKFLRGKFSHPRHFLESFLGASFPARPSACFGV